MKVIVLLCAVWLAGFVSSMSIDELGYNEENCKSIREDPSSIGFVPCECKLNTGILKAIPCYPNCCPKTEDYEGDRCHTENRLKWSVYEQQVCFPSPPKESIDDTPNCFYRGNIPKVFSVTAAAGFTKIEFELSLLTQHKCHNLYIAGCNSARVRLDDFRINTTDATPQHCWLRCSPKPLAECTEAECWAHRGETPAVVRSWTVQRQLSPGDYALVCYTMVQAEASESSLYQTAYSTIGFKVV